MVSFSFFDTLRDSAAFVSKLLGRSPAWKRNLSKGERPPYFCLLGGIIPRAKTSPLRITVSGETGESARDMEKYVRQISSSQAKFVNFNRSGFDRFCNFNQSQLSFVFLNYPLQVFASCNVLPNNYRITMRNRKILWRK